MPFTDTNTTSVIMTGAMMHRMAARLASMVSVMMMPPKSMIGARMPMVWIMRVKFWIL